MPEALLGFGDKPSRLLDTESSLGVKRPTAQRTGNALADQLPSGLLVENQFRSIVSRLRFIYQI